jgi:hypothetical protein
MLNPQSIASIMNGVIIITQSILHVHYLFHSKFSTEGNLVRPLSICSTFLFPWGPVVAYIFFLVLPSLQFLHKVWPIQLAYLRFMVRKMFLASNLHNTSSLFTWSVQLISIFYGTTFQNFQGTSNLPPEVSKFQYQSHAPNVAIHWFLP